MPTRKEKSVHTEQVTGSTTSGTLTFTGKTLAIVFEEIFYMVVDLALGIFLFIGFSALMILIMIGITWPVLILYILVGSLTGLYNPFWMIPYI